MKKVLLAIMLCIASCGTALSQKEESKKSDFQLSLIAPLSTNGVRSYQYSNKTSFNMLVGLSKNESALTVGGLANIILNNAEGFQFAGLTNYIGGKGKGMSFAGVANINKGNYSGFQFAGAVNIAKDVSGFQFGGLMNKAKSVEGVQLAGFINIAEDSDYPIGFINLIKNGEKGIAITYNELGSTMITFRSGGKMTYGIIGVGYNHKTSGRAYATEAGLGMHINCLSWLRINNELKAICFGYSSNSFIIDDDYLSNTVFSVNYSILPAFRVSSHVELFGGVSLNYVNAANANRELLPNHSIWKRLGSSRFQQIHFGYQVGMQYIF